MYRIGSAKAVFRSGGDLCQNKRSRDRSLAVRLLCRLHTPGIRITERMWVVRSIHVRCVGAANARIVQAGFRCLCQHRGNGAIQVGEISRCVRDDLSGVTLLRLMA